jgi:hypothetical protein
MAEFNVRADAVDVEQIMRQIRARIREKRGVDYTEEQVQELARVRLEKFLDPKGLRSDLLEQFRRRSEADVPSNYDFDDTTLFKSDKPLVAFIRRLLQPVLKLFFSPNALNTALHLQSRINRHLLEHDALFYEVVHNLVVEMTRTGIDVKNMQMRVESVAGRLDFNERRARALEAVVQYRPDALGERRTGGSTSAEGTEEPGQGGRPAAIDPLTGGESLRSRRRRRRRGRRSGPGFGAPTREAGDERRSADERRPARDEPLNALPPEPFERPASRESVETATGPQDGPVDAPGVAQEGLKTLSDERPQSAESRPPTLEAGPSSGSDSDPS